MDTIDLDDLLIFDEFKDDPEPPEDPQPPEDPEHPPTKETEDVVEEEEEDEKDGSPEDLNSYYDILKETELIVVPDDFEFDGTEEGLQKAFDYTKEHNEMLAAQALWSRLPDDFKPLLQYALKGGNSIEEYMSAYSGALKDLSVSTPDDQRKVMAAYYKATSKYSDEKINKLIDRLEDDGDLETEAIESLQELKDMQALQQEELMKKAEEDAKNRRLQAAQQVQQINEAINAIPDTVRQNKIKAFFFNAVAKPNGGSATEFDLVLSSIKDNPQHLVQLADIFLEYDPKAGFNLERYVKQGKTQATKKLSALLEDKLNSKSKVKGTGSESKNKSDDFDWKNYFNY